MKFFKNSLYLNRMTRRSKRRSGIRKKEKEELALAELFRIAESSPEWVADINKVLGNKRTKEYLEGFADAVHGTKESSVSADYVEGFRRATHEMENARSKRYTEQQEAMDEVIVASEYARYLLTKNKGA